MINLEKLGEIKVPVIIEVATATKNSSMIIELTDNTVLNIWNGYSEGIDLEGTYENFDQFFEEVMDNENFEQLYSLQLEMTKEVQKTMPEVKAIYID